MEKIYYQTLKETLFHEKLENGLEVYLLPKIGFEKTYGLVDLISFVMLLLGAYAAYDINSRPTVRPSGYTCLWWIYSTLAKKI